MVDLQTQIDAAVACNVAPDEYFSVWDESGVWQLEALKRIGLQPRHKLLDFGCGAFRLGLLAIDYLDDENYYGIDAFAPYIEIGRKLAVAAGITKKYNAAVSRDFEFDRLGTEFDFGIAQSVFTHMSGDECERCMAALKKTMKPGGTFLFTFLIGAPVTRGMLYLGAEAMQRFAMNDPDFFAALASRHGVTFERLDIPHLTGQQVAVFAIFSPQDRIEKPMQRDAKVVAMSAEPDKDEIVIDVARVTKRFKLYRNAVLDPLKERLLFAAASAVIGCTSRWMKFRLR